MTEASFKKGRRMDARPADMLRGAASLALALAFALALAACGHGSSVDDDDGRSSSDLQAETVGIVECYGCHKDGLIAEFEAEAVYSTWKQGPHGNYESVDSYDEIVDYGADNAGFPYFGYEGMAQGSSCSACHDQTEDGLLIKDYYESTGDTDLGRVNRPLVGCESCHGSGADHFGIGDVEYPRPDASRCGQCHNSGIEDDHLTYHPEADEIYEDYSSSAHATSSRVLGTALCSRCHTDEGAQAYAARADGTLGNAALEAAMAGADDIDDPTPVQCRTCHDNHDPDRLLLAASTDASGGALSAEYRTCTACHQLADASGGRHESYHGSWGASAEIVDTHMDDASTSNIEGYVIDPSDDRACRACHNVHGADLDINGQWADSSHGGFIGRTYLSSTGLSNVTESEAPAFVHYDFKNSSGGSSGYGYQACQKCHTSTGFKNYADDPSGYDQDGDGYPDELNEFTASDSEREMLYCWACHTSSAGTLRDPGAVTADYTDAPYTFPDVEGSNICISCHRGRESGETIKNSDDDFSDKSFVNAHYLSAGGTVFTATGYEYDGLSYAPASYFLHNSIGLSSSTGGVGGENGPCIGCHMNHSEGHTFRPVETDSADAITDIEAFEGTCSSCHTDKAALMAEMNGLREEFEAALDALEAQLSGKGYAYSSSYPYFSSKNWTSVYPNGKDTMGAAFNYNLLLNDPGGYAHNSQYTKRLLYDSIDFIDDGSLNSSVEATLGGSGDAYDYLAGARP